MGAYAQRMEHRVRQCLVHDPGDDRGFMSIAYLSPTEAIELGRQMVELGEEILREEASERNALEQLQVSHRG